jgi:hypothetical protein
MSDLGLLLCRLTPEAHFAGSKIGPSAFDKQKRLNFRFSPFGASDDAAPIRGSRIQLLRFLLSSLFLFRNHASLPLSVVVPSAGLVQVAGLILVPGPRLLIANNETQAGFARQSKNQNITYLSMA